MFRKSGNRFSERNMRQIKRMFRKSGNRFSERNMRKSKKLERITIESDRDAL